MTILLGGVFIFGCVLALAGFIVGRTSSGRSGYEGDRRLFGVFDRFELSQWESYMPRRRYLAVYYSVSIGVGLMCLVLIGASIFGVWRNFS